MATLRDQEEMANSRVFCLDYDGNPIAELIIESTSTIAVDEKDHRLLVIDPNNDESNLIVYDLPEFLR